jgi:hypothetical protein
LPVSNARGDRLTDQLALQAIEEFVFRARAFQVRLRQQHDRFVRRDLRRRLTQLFDLRGHATAQAQAHATARRDGHRETHGRRDNSVHDDLQEVQVL